MTSFLPPPPEIIIVLSFWSLFFVFTIIFLLPWIFDINVLSTKIAKLLSVEFNLSYLLINFNLYLFKQTQFTLSLTKDKISLSKDKIWLRKQKLPTILQIKLSNKRKKNFFLDKRTINKKLALFILFRPC
jgi:hypothetical protein